MPNPTYSLTITEADLDRAIARRAQPGYDYTMHCLLAQAVARQEGHPVPVAYSFEPKGREESFTTCRDQEACDLIEAFDNEHYDTIRPKLPATFTLPKRN